MTTEGGALPNVMTAAELATIGVDGLPRTKRGINLMREREGWRVESVARSNRKLIDVASLPESIREAIAEKLAARPAATVIPANDQRRFAGRPRGTDFFARHPEIAEAVESIVARQRLSATVVLDLLRDQFAQLPHLRALQRHIRALEAQKPALLASMRDPDLYKGRYRVALGRADGGVDHANQVWELDATKADVMTLDGRKTILGVIDRWSRRVRFLVAPSESGQSVRRLLIDTICAWGVMPEIVVTDQGSGFINASIRSALEALGIEHRPCPPASGDKKPYIERIFGTFTRDRAELLPGYLGHNVAEAQRLRAVARARTGRPVIVAEIRAERLQEILHAWVAGAYELRVHSGIGMSPLSKWQSSPRPSAAAPCEDTLRIALSALVGRARVGKRGVQWKRGRYWSAALAAWVGRMVQVRRDEEDLGALFVFDEDGRFIDTAVNAHRSGLSEEAFAAAARAQQATYMNAARADVRAAQSRFGFEQARDQLLRRDAEAAGKLVALPRPVEPRVTPQLASFEVPPVAPTVLRLPVAAPRQDPGALEERVARAEQLVADAAAGCEVDPKQLEWARAFVTGPAFRTHQAAERTFGTVRRIS